MSVYNLTNYAAVYEETYKPSLRFSFSFVFFVSKDNLLEFHFLFYLTFVSKRNV